MNLYSLMISVPFVSVGKRHFGLFIRLKLFERKYDEPKATFCGQHARRHFASKTNVEF
jgi:hypothetical protein